MQVPLLEEGAGALRKLNKSMGLAFDDWDIEYYTKVIKTRARMCGNSVCSE